MNRRQFLALGAVARAMGTGIEPVRNAPSRINADAPDQLSLDRFWQGDSCRSQLGNHGSHAVRVREVVLFDIHHDLPANTQLYGESFQMLSQTAGTLAEPINLGYDELKHYKIPQPADATVLTGLMTLAPPAGDITALAFTSC